MMNESKEMKQKNRKQRSQMATGNVFEKYTFTMQSKVGNGRIRQKTSKGQRKGIVSVRRHLDGETSTKRSRKGTPKKTSKMWRVCAASLW